MKHHVLPIPPKKPATPNKTLVEALKNAKLFLWDGKENWRWNLPFICNLLPSHYHKHIEERLYPHKTTWPGCGHKR